MSEPTGSIFFCKRPWRAMGAVVAALVLITFVWGMTVLATYRNDDRFGGDRNLSVTAFLGRNIALGGDARLPEAIAPAVVAIDDSKVNGGILASGIIVGANGYVLTTLHEIEGLSEITVRVRTSSGIRPFGAQIVKRAPAHDLVMLKIKSAGSFLYLSLAARGGYPAGINVLALGQSANGTLIVRQGVMSGQPETLAVEGLQISHLRATDAVTSWEQNGGPVVNAAGALVGITLAVQDGAGGVRGYVVPADVIDAHFRDVVNFKRAEPSAAVTFTPSPPPVAAVPPVAAEGGAMAMEAAMAPGAGARGPLGEEGTRGAARWWVRAASQVAPTGLPVGLNAAPNGPPVVAAAEASVDVEHLLGFRIAGFPIEDLIGLTLLSLAKGVIGGMMTMGGGVFLVAGMMVFFGYGLFLIRPVAYLTNLFVYSASAMRHSRNGLIQWEEVKSLAPWAVIGVIGGYFIGNAIADRLVELMLATFACLVALKAGHEVLGAEDADEILLAGNGDHRRRTAGALDTGAESGADTGADGDQDFLDEGTPAAGRTAAASMGALARPALLALPMGVISGILGITGGVVEVPLQHYIGKVPLRNAIANSSVLVFCASATGTLLSFIHGTSTGLIDWRAPLTLAAVLIPTSFAGGVMGAHLTRLAPKKVLKGVFSVLMLAVAIRMFVGH